MASASRVTSAPQWSVSTPTRCRPIALVIKESRRAPRDGARGRCHTRPSLKYGASALCLCVALRLRADLRGECRRPLRSVRRAKKIDTPSAPRSDIQFSAGDLKLPPCACRSKLSGAEVFIIGTAHISSRSAADVEELITLLKPDSIVVELSCDRISSLYPASATKSENGSLVVQLAKTDEGFVTVTGAEEPARSAIASEGELIICGPDPGQVDRVPMRRPLSSSSDAKWLETTMKKHRYRSETYQLQPAVDFMISIAKGIFPRAQRAFYLSVFTVKQTGSEFAAASRCARKLDCPIVLGDVESEDLFDPLGAVHVTRDDSLLVRLAGPCIRPPGPGAGVDLFEALQHVLGGTTKPGVGSRLLLSYAVVLVAGLAMDGFFDPSSSTSFGVESAWMVMAAMGMCNLLLAATISFLLTATRDEQLFRALAEAAAQSTAQRGGAGGGRVVLVCGLAHVNGIARHVAKAAERECERSRG